VRADAKPDTLLVMQVGFAVKHAALHLGGTAHRFNDARELHEQAVAGGLNEAPLVLRDLRIDQFAEAGLEPLVRPLLIGPHQARVPRHVGSEDRGEAAGLAHVLSPAARRRPDK